METLHVDLKLEYPEFTLELEHAFTLTGITALFGQSGSGKSTLLRIIAGLERNAKGTVTFASNIWQDPQQFIRPHLRGIGYVFQDTRLFPHLNVAGNLRYADKRAKHIPSQITMENVIDALDLAPLLNRQTPDLSGGERQRVAIARTLLTRPQLLLMDEPLAALDRSRKVGLLPYIAMLPETFGIPVIYVTHSIEEVTRLADRIVALDNGRLLTSGEVSETLERLELAPASGKFAAGSVIEATVVGQDERFMLTELSVAGQPLRMPRSAVNTGDSLRLRIRARDVALATVRPEGVSIRNILAGKIIEIIEEKNTAFAEVLVDIGEGQRIRARVTRAAIFDLNLSVNSPVFALIKGIAFDRRALPRARKTTPQADQ